MTIMPELAKATVKSAPIPALDPVTRAIFPIHLSMAVAFNKVGTVRASNAKLDFKQRNNAWFAYVLLALWTNIGLLLASMDLFIHTVYCVYLGY